MLLMGKIPRGDRLHVVFGQGMLTVVEHKSLLSKIRELFKVRCD